jgi:hypothetical protein
MIGLIALGSVIAFLITMAIRDLGPVLRQRRERPTASMSAQVHLATLRAVERINHAARMADWELERIARSSESELGLHDRR